MHCSYAMLLNYWHTHFFRDIWKKKGPKCDAIYNLEPIFEPEGHHAYSWLKTAEHMCSLRLHLRDTRKSGHPLTLMRASLVPPTQLHRSAGSSGPDRPLSASAALSQQPLVSLLRTASGPGEQQSLNWSCHLLLHQCQNEAVTHIMCMSMSVKELKSALPIWTCLTDLRLFQGCFFFFFNLISAERFLSSETGFSLTMVTWAAVIQLLTLFQIRQYLN